MTASFPNQDTLPKGRFGNLIALPLQWTSREKGNSVFINHETIPYPDQWLFLSNIQKLSYERLETIVQEAFREGGIINIRMCLTDETSDEDPWTLPPSQKSLERTITDPLPEEVEIVHGDLIYVEKAGMPSSLITRLLRLAALENPEFFRAQAMRLPTYNKPRPIYSRKTVSKAYWSTPRVFR